MSPKPKPKNQLLHMAETFSIQSITLDTISNARATRRTFELHLAIAMKRAQARLAEN